MPPPHPIHHHHPLAFYPNLPFSPLPFPFIYSPHIPHPHLISRSLFFTSLGFHLLLLYRNTYQGFFFNFLSLFLLLHKGREEKPPLSSVVVQQQQQLMDLYISMGFCTYASCDYIYTLQIWTICVCVCVFVIRVIYIYIYLYVVGLRCSGGVRVVWEWSSLKSNRGSCREE